MTIISNMLSEQLSRLQSRALTVGAILILGGLLYAFAMGEMAGFYQAYLVGYMVCTGVTLVCMAFVMLHHLIGGRWGFVIQRLLEAVMGTLPLLLVLFIPILLGMHDLYHWTHKEAVAADPILQHKEPYLNVPFFIVRTLFYFAIWIAASFLLIKWSIDQDKSGDPRLTDKIRSISGPGVVVFLSLIHI